VRPYWPQTISATAISATTRRYRPQQKNHIGHTENQYRPQPYRPKLYRPQNIRRVYLASYPVDTSLFRVGPGRIVNLNVKPRIRPIGQKESYRPTSPVIEKMNVRFFKPANILLGYRCLLFPHSRHSISCPA